jgi:hypothetical protein
MAYSVKFNSECCVRLRVNPFQLILTGMGSLYRYLTGGILTGPMFRTHAATTGDHCCRIYFIKMIPDNFIFYLYYNQMVIILAGGKPYRKINYLKYSLVEDITEQNIVLPAKIFMIFREERTPTGE